jgi:hypothetical protein
VPPDSVLTTLPVETPCPTAHLGFVAVIVCDNAEGVVIVKVAVVVQLLASVIVHVYVLPATDPHKFE